jgi:hypothetical protein
MKKLTIKEIPNEIGEITQIQIVEQTQRCSLFGITGSYFTHNGFVLDSQASPEISDGRLYVQGNNYSKDNLILDVSSKEWLESMRAAVKAYNEYFCNCDKCIDRKCNSCPVDNKERK